MMSLTAKDILPYRKCMEENVRQSKYHREFIMPPGAQNYKKELDNTAGPIKNISDSIKMYIEDEKEAQTPLERSQLKFHLDSFDLVVRKVLNSNISQLKELLQEDFVQEYLPLEDGDEVSGSTSATSFKSVASRVSTGTDMGNQSDTEVYKQWRRRVRKIKRMAERKAKMREERQNTFEEKLKGSTSNRSVRSQTPESDTKESMITSKSLFEEKDNQPWQPLKIIIGPQFEDRKFPSIIPISDPHDIVSEKSRMERTLKQKIKASSLFQLSGKHEMGSVVTSNTELFFLRQVKEENYLRSLFVLTEHFKQSDLLMRSLQLGIEKFTFKSKQHIKKNEAVKKIKTKLNDQLNNIRKDFKQLYAILGIKDIARVDDLLPKRERFAERKYGFVEEVELKNIIQDYHFENLLVREKFDSMNIIQ